MNLLWWSSGGFPGPWPIRQFKRYIRYHEHPVDAFYNAYPGATIRDILSALELQKALQQMASMVALTPSDLEALYGDFVAQHTDLFRGNTRRRAPSPANAAPKGLQL